MVNATKINFQYLGKLWWTIIAEMKLLISYSRINSASLRATAVEMKERRAYLDSHDVACPTVAALKSSGDEGEGSSPGQP